MIPIRERIAIAKALVATTRARLEAERRSYGDALAFDGSLPAQKRAQAEREIAVAERAYEAALQQVASLEAWLPLETIRDMEASLAEATADLERLTLALADAREQYAKAEKLAEILRLTAEALDREATLASMKRTSRDRALEAYRRDHASDIYAARDRFETVPA